MSITLRINLKHCHEADLEHYSALRQYAHTGHFKNTICFAESFIDLPRHHQAGLLAHEIGHIIMLLKRQDHYEPDADEAARRYLDVSVRYAAKTPWGEDLQYLILRDVVRLMERVVYLPDDNAIIVRLGDGKGEYE